MKPKTEFFITVAVLAFISCVLVICSHEDVSLPKWAVIGAFALGGFNLVLAAIKMKKGSSTCKSRSVHEDTPAVPPSSSAS